MANPLVNVTRGNSGDFDLFVDDDGTGYIVYSAYWIVSIEQLTPDFLHSTGNVSTPNPFPDYFVEAPTFVSLIGSTLTGLYCSRNEGSTRVRRAVQTKWHLLRPFRPLLLLLPARQWTVRVHCVAPAGTMDATTKRGQYHTTEHN